MVQSLFETKKMETNAYIKAKGPGGFFHTIASCPDERVQRAWRLSCGNDPRVIKKINDAVNKQHVPVPPAFQETWHKAVLAAFGSWTNSRGRGGSNGFKPSTQLKPYHPDIKCLHLYQIVRKA